MVGVANGRHSYTATDRAGNTSSACANVAATFFEAMNPKTLTASTVKLVRSGTTTVVPAAVSYDAATRKVTLTPSSNLTAGTKYTATVATGAKDLAGNPLSTAKTWSFTGRR